MPSTAFDSFYFEDRFGTARMRRIWNDRATLQRWLDVEAALAETESELEMVPSEIAAEIREKARIDLVDLKSLKEAFDTTWNPVVPLVNELRKLVSPKAARYVHWGATSGNVFNTGMALQVSDSFDLIRGELASIGDQLAELARSHRHTVMAGRTHGQHATPVTLGFKAAVWLDEVMRHLERLEEGRGRILVGEFGGAVGTLDSFGESGFEVRDRLLTRLGLGIPEMPVKTAGDRFCEFVLLLSMISATLGKIAQNIYNLQLTEIDEVTEFTEGKVGSSAMPHKQNPVASGSIVFLGRLLRTNAIAALDYINAEWESDHRQGETAWKFLPESCLLASVQLQTMRRLLGSLVVKPDHMLRNLGNSGGFVCSESLMMALAESVGRDSAHDLVMTISRQAKSDGASLSEVASAHPEVRRHLSAESLAHCLDPANCLGLTQELIDRVLRGWLTSRHADKQTS